MRTKRKMPELVLRKGKPAAVIIDIDDYQEMLERLEDCDDLRELEEMRKAAGDDLRALAGGRLQDHL